MNKRERQLIEEAARAKAVWQAKKEKIRVEKQRAREQRDAEIYTDYVTVTGSQPELPVMDVYAILMRLHGCSHSVVYHALKAHNVDMTRGRARRERGRK